MPSPPQQRDVRAQSLGSRIRERRLELGMSQADLAGEIGGNPGDISKIEHGRVKLPRRPKLELIAQALQLPLGELLARSGWSDVGSYLSEINESDMDRLSLVGPRAELAALIPHLSMRDAESLLSHANYLLKREGGDRRSSPDAEREPA